MQLASSISESAVCTGLFIVFWATTPDELYADTSTEIALNLAKSKDYAEYDTATVVNNHFDVDGVLSAWAATDPESALPHFQLLCDAAACGDFGEWPSDEGVKLCYAVAELEDPSADDGGYASALKKLPDVVRNLDAYEDLWGPGFAGVCDDYDDMSDGFGEVSEGAGDIALVMEPPGRRARSPVSIRRPGAFDSRRCDAIDAVPRRRWTASLGKRE